MYDDESDNDDAPDDPFASQINRMVGAVTPQSALKKVKSVKRGAVAPKVVRKFLVTQHHDGTEKRIELGKKSKLKPKLPGY